MYRFLIRAGPLVGDYKVRSDESRDNIFSIDKYRMADSRMREDVESAYLDITEYVGQSLTGPRDLITRRILCSNPQITITEAAAALNAPALGL